MDQGIETKDSHDVKLAPRIIRRALAQRHLEDIKFSLRGVGMKVSKNSFPSTNGMTVVIRPPRYATLSGKPSEDMTGTGSE